MTTETLTGTEVATLVETAESESEQEQVASAKMTDAERAEAYKKVKPIAVRSDNALAKSEVAVAEGSLKFGQTLLLVQSFQLWKAPKVKDERGRLVRQFKSYAKWYEGQGFKTSKSRGAQCVTIALDDFNSREALAQAQYVAELGEIGITDISDIVTFSANRQKGSTGRGISVESRAAQVLKAVETFNTKLNDLTLDADGNVLDEAFANVVRSIQVSLNDNVRDSLTTWAEGGIVEQDDDDEDAS